MTAGGGDLTVTVAQLRAFLSALDQGSFTAAAKELDTTQASISELVARLERILGARLFVRGSRRLTPTAAAEELSAHAHRAISAIDNGLQAVRALTSLEGGSCTFGVLRNAAYYELSDLVERFHALYPKVKVRLVGLNSALVAESVAAGEVEAGLVVLPVAASGLTIRPLFRDEVLYASASRPSDAGPIGIEEIATAKLVLYDAYAGWSDPTRWQLRERARLAGLDIDPDIEVEHVETALDVVAGGRADTIVSRTITEGASFPTDVRTWTLREPLYDTVALIRRSGTTLSPATRRLARLAEQTLLEQAPHHAGWTLIG